MIIQCDHCGKKIEKETAYRVKYGKKYFCDEQCYIEYNKPPLKLCATCGIEMQPSTEIDKYGLLFCSKVCVKDYEDCPDNAEKVCLTYVWDDLSGKTANYLVLKAQAKHMVETYGQNYTAMLWTCKYWHEVLGRVWNPEYNLGQILPYFYEEAKEFYTQRKRIHESIKDTDLTPTVKVVKANTDKRFYKIHLDDMEDL